MKLSFPKLTSADVMGLSTVLGAGAFAILHYALKVDAASSGAVSAAIAGVLGYVIPDTNINASGAALNQLFEDGMRAIATKNLAAAIPALTTDALQAIAAMAQANAASQPILIAPVAPVAPVPVAPTAPVVTPTAPVVTPTAPAAPNIVVTPAVPVAPAAIPVATA